jgi:hypothetical protein
LIGLKECGQPSGVVVGRIVAATGTAAELGKEAVLALGMVAGADGGDTL